MKKKYIKVFFYLLMVVITVAYTYYFKPITDDELYNYGFSYNIINGLVPYRDFNMIITPLFSYLFALILKVFGTRLIVYHIVLAIMFSIIFFLCYKSIGKTAFIIYLLLLIYPYVGYNIFSLVVLFILFYFNDKKIKRLDILEPILISIMFLTKQSLGVMVIPSLIYSKNKKKTLIIYLIFIFGFLIYLLANNMCYQFFDYCLFGMFDFAESNSTSVSLLMIIELLIIGALLYFSFATKRKDILFCLMFQIMTLPIVNYIHFIISFVPVVYLILKKYNENSYVKYLGLITVISFFITFNIVYWTKGQNYLNAAHYDINNFMENRVTYKYTNQFLLNVGEYMDIYDDYTLFTLGSFSYLVKLSFDIPINKYDLINDGNMGYNGAERYLDEIDDICSRDKCLFVINESDINSEIYNQINNDILEYVINNNTKIYASSIFSIYIN